MRDKTHRVAEDLNTAGVGFLLAELDTAITFCQGALTSADPARAQHDVEQAKRALETAARFKERVRLSDAHERQFAEKTSRLQSFLGQLATRRQCSGNRG